MSALDRLSALGHILLRQISLYKNVNANLTHIFRSVNFVCCTKKDRTLVFRSLILVYGMQKQHMLTHHILQYLRKYRLTTKLYKRMRWKRDTTFHPRPHRDYTGPLSFFGKVLNELNVPFLLERLFYLKLIIFGEWIISVKN